MRPRRGQRRLKLDLGVVGVLAAGATVPGIGNDSNQQAEVRGWRLEARGWFKCAERLGVAPRF
jgi:hypothetical protein